MSGPDDRREWSETSKQRENEKKRGENVEFIAGPFARTRENFSFLPFHLALSLLFHSCTYLFFAISLPPFWVIDGQTERITRLLTFEMKSNHSIWCRKKLNFSLIVSSVKTWNVPAQRPQQPISMGQLTFPISACTFREFHNSLFLIFLCSFLRFSVELLCNSRVFFLFSVEVRMKFLGGNCVYFKIWIGPTRARTGRTLLWEHWEFAFSHFSFGEKERRRGRRNENSHLFI